MAGSSPTQARQRNTPCPTRTQRAPIFQPNGTPQPTLTPEADGYDPCAERTLTPSDTPRVSPIFSPHVIIDPETSCVVSGEPIDYQNFSSTSNLCLVNGADKDQDHNNALLLARVTDQYKAGAAWYGAKQNVAGGFVAAFTFSMDNGVSGADGLAFVIQNQARNVVGEAARGLGYTGITDSLAIEFDIHWNSQCDPTQPPPQYDGDHIAINSNGSAANDACQHRAALILNDPEDDDSIDDGEVHDVIVRYSPATYRLDVTLDGTYTLTWTVQGGLKNYLGLSDEYAYVGFTAATGDWTANHRIYRWTMVTADTPLQPDTVGVFRPATGGGKGTFYLRNTNTTGVADITKVLDFSTSSDDLPLVGDWDGDGVDGLGIYRANGNYLLIPSADYVGSPTINKTFGNSGDLPVVGDWDGDGIDSIGVFRPSTGRWYLSNSNQTPTTVYGTSFGAAGELPVVGDWDGDGVDTIGTFRPSNGNWYLTNTRLVGTNAPSPTADLIFTFGGAPETGLVVVGNWHGRLIFGVGLKRSSQILLRYLLSTGSADLSFTYGTTPDLPVGGKWQPICPAGSAPGDMCVAATSTPTPITFQFDAARRKEAAEYALNWAGKACPMFCAFQFQPYVDMSHYPAGTPTPSATDFRCVGGDSTDCANFLSQAYFLTGAPLTLNWYCAYGTKPICVRGSTDLGGWAGAGRSDGLPYYLNTLGGWDSYGTAVPDKNFDPNSGPGNELYPWKTLAELPTPGPMPSKIATLMATLSAQGVGRGDLMYTFNQVPYFRHVMLVVGWGPYVETWAQLAQVNTSQIVATYSPNAPVLYVVDHGPQGEYALQTTPVSQYAAQLKGAKPYYASRWRSVPVDGDDNWVSGDRNFVRMPDNYAVSWSDAVTPDAKTQLLRTIMPTGCPILTRLP